MTSHASRPRKAHACRSKKCHHHNNKKSHVCRSTKCHHKSKHQLRGRSSSGRAVIHGGNALPNIFNSKPEVPENMLIDIKDQSDDIQQKLHKLLGLVSEKAEKLHSEDKTSSRDDEKHIMDDYYHRLSSHIHAGLNELTKLNAHVANMEFMNDALTTQ